MPNRFLFVRSPDLDDRWPYVPAQVATRLSQLGELDVVNTKNQVPLSEQTELNDVNGLIYFPGGPSLTDACIAAAPNLKMVGAVADNAGFGLPIEAIFQRDIPLIDGTRGWAQSVAEIGLSLALSALRRLPWWHARMSALTPHAAWQYEADQFCDDKRFVNGTLGTKKVGIVGLGQIGRRVAEWCHCMGASVVGYDPFLPKAAAQECGATLIDLDQLIVESELLFITVPPTPSAEKIVSRERVFQLRTGALVVIVTRAHGIDMDALRKRIINNELMGALDVYDEEPVPANDPLLNRENVIHTPHIAGRTRDANIAAIDVIVDDFQRILLNEQPLARVTREMVDIRLYRKDVPEDA
ncbi:MAG: hypothetical protein HOH43_04310 [Candidatus Latescibacteria bacterium]|nr:hypothetical protein [Candidatus Latescibacterota bacterium]